MFKRLNLCLQCELKRLNLCLQGEFIYFHKAKINIVGIIRMIQGALMFEWSYSLTTDHNAATTVRYICPCFSPPIRLKGRRGHDRMLVVFTTTCAISAYRQLWVRIPLMARCTRYNFI